MSLLEVDDLHVTFPTRDGDVQAVRGVSFTVEAGQTLGIVGESGSGKSVCCMTIVGLTPGAEVSGQARFDGVDLTALDDEALRPYRGARISLVFQDPLSSLHPYYRIGWQIEEMIRAHEPASRRQARARAIELLGLVGIPRPERRIDDYPHQFSGGMRQRALIAMALALEPDLIIADEPTTALDATVQAQILDLLRRLQQEMRLALVLITHDLGVIAELADQVVVMYAGTVVERADRRTLFYRQHHPYTGGLLASVPTAAPAADAGPGRRLVPIPGQPPSLIAPPPGCPFEPRCRFAMDRCRVERPALHPVDGGAAGHVSACYLGSRLVGAQADPGRREYAAQSFQLNGRRA